MVCLGTAWTILPTFAEYIPTGPISRTFQRHYNQVCRSSFHSTYHYNMSVRYTLQLGFYLPENAFTLRSGTTIGLATQMKHCDGLMANQTKYNITISPVHSVIISSFSCPKTLWSRPFYLFREDFV